MSNCFTLFRNILSWMVGTYHRILLTEISLNVTSGTHNCCLKLLKNQTINKLRDGERLKISIPHIFKQYVGLSTSQSNMQHHLFWKQILIRKLKLIFISLSVLYFKRFDCNLFQLLTSLKKSTILGIASLELFEIILNFRMHILYALP